MTRYEMYEQYTVEQLVSMLERLRQVWRRDSGGIALYPKSVARKMDDIAWVIAWKTKEQREPHE